MKKENKLFTPDELFSMNQTEQIKNSKAKDIKKSFYHYTTVEALEKILEKDEKGNRFFFVRNISVMNDKNEAKWHETDAERIHSFCTCCTGHEQIPLWYLYSGICGRGARIGFTPGKMLKFLNSVDTAYPITDNKVDYSLPLKIDCDFTFMCGWVFYLMDGNNRVWYRNNSYPVEMLTEEILESNLFIKNYPWAYEKEFRIIIRNKTENIYEKIAIPVPDAIVSSFEIMFAPEYELKDNEKEKYVQRGIKSERIKNSKLNISMNLLENNKKDILQEIDKWCEEDKCQHICNFVKSKNKCKNSEGKQNENI